MSMSEMIMTGYELGPKGLTPHYTACPPEGTIDEVTAKIDSTAKKAFNQIERVCLTAEGLVVWFKMRAFYADRLETAQIRFQISEKLFHAKKEKDFSSIEDLTRQFNMIEERLAYDKVEQEKCISLLAEMNSEVKGVKK
jgi:hypothetical protein